MEKTQNLKQNENFFIFIQFKTAKNIFEIIIFLISIARWHQVNFCRNVFTFHYHLPFLHQWLKIAGNFHIMEFHPIVYHRYLTG